jgi:transposase
VATLSERDRARTKELIAALSRIQELSDPERQSVAENAAEMLTALREEVERLSAQVRWLAGKPYRPSKENAPPGQLAFELIQLLTGGGAATESNDEEEPPPPKPQPKKPAKRSRRGRQLPREVVENRLPEEERRCPDCGTPRAEIGFDSSERLVYQPATVICVEERNFKYACRKGCCGVEQAEPTLPPKPIPGGPASSSLLAHIIVSKMLDGLPIERIAKRLRRHGVDLATSTLNDWMGRAAAMFSFLHTLLHKELLSCSLVSLDDTPMPAKSRDHPSGMQRGRMWIYLGDLDRIAYSEFTPDWKGIHPRRVLEGFDGDVQNDGYAGINPLFVGDAPCKRVGCNDHARRRFVEALEQRDGRAQPVVDLYRALYLVEAEARDAGLDADGTVALRRTKSAPLWAQLTEIIAELATRAQPKTPLGKAVTYWQRQEPHLRAFLENGHLPISNAHVERQMRTVALFRKNSLFFGSVEAGQRHAVLLSVLLNCVLAGVNPYDYLVDVIDKIAADWPAARADELLPRNWLEARQREDELDRGSVAAS